MSLCFHKFNKCFQMSVNPSKTSNGQTWSLHLTVRLFLPNTPNLLFPVYLCVCALFSFYFLLDSLPPRASRSGASGLLALTLPVKS